MIERNHCGSVSRRRWEPVTGAAPFPLSKLPSVRFECPTSDPDDAAEKHGHASRPVIGQSVPTAKSGTLIAFGDDRPTELRRTMSSHVVDPTNDGQSTTRH